MMWRLLLVTSPHQQEHCCSMAPKRPIYHQLLVTFATLYSIVSVFLFQFHMLMKNRVEKTLSCPHEGCYAMFSSSRGLQLHKERHKGNYQYHCPYCNKGLSATRDVKLHLKSLHTGLLGFHCNKCSQEFSSVRLLKQHLDAEGCAGEGLTI